MGDAAVAGANSVNYVGVGTIEFLLDVKRLLFYGNEYCIQVEHQSLRW